MDEEEYKTNGELIASNFCDGKRCYESQGRAKQIAHGIMRQRKKKLRVYSCHLCYHWHLTSEKKGRIKRAK